MEKAENNGSYNYIFNSKGEKNPSFKSLVIHSDLLVSYKDIDLNSLIEEYGDNKNENDNGEYSWLKDYNSFLDEENKKTENKID